MAQPPVSFKTDSNAGGSDTLSVSLLGTGWLGLPLGIFLSARGMRVLGSTTTSSRTALLRSHHITPFLIHAHPESILPSPFMESEVLIITLPFKRSLLDPWEYYHTIRAILEQLPATVASVIFTSSTAVYPETGGIVTEETPTDSSPRAKALAATETLILQHSPHSYVLRLAGLYGPEREPGRFLRHYTPPEVKKNIPVPNGLAPINLVHRDDCIAVIHQLIIQRPASCILNVVADGHPLKHDFYTQKAQEQGLVIPQFDLSPPSYKIVSNEAVKGLLNVAFTPIG